MCSGLVVVRMLDWEGWGVEGLVIFNEITARLPSTEHTLHTRVGHADPLHRELHDGERRRAHRGVPPLGAGQVSTWGFSRVSFGSIWFGFHFVGPWVLRFGLGWVGCHLWGSRLGVQDK